MISLSFFFLGTLATAYIKNQEDNYSLVKEFIFNSLSEDEKESPNIINREVKEKKTEQIAENGPLNTFTNFSFITETDQNENKKTEDNNVYEKGEYKTHPLNSTSSSKNLVGMKNRSRAEKRNIITFLQKKQNAPNPSDRENKNEIEKGNDNAGDSENASQEKDSTDHLCFVRDPKNTFLTPCFNDCVCYPVFIPVLIFALMLYALTFYFIYDFMKLIPENSLKEYIIDGGWVLLLATGLGGIIGFIAGYFLFSCVSFALLSSSSFQALLNSIILLNRKGGLLGSIAGAYLGLLFGVLIYSSYLSIILSIFGCLILGAAIGYAPIFSNFSINTLYMSSLETYQDSDEL